MLTEEHDLLVQAARPELYRQNAFRVAGLPVDATPREVARHRDRLKMLARLGARGRETAGLLPLQPPPDDDAVHEALERVRDPESRLVDEFFWFWPAHPGRKDDPALPALAAGRFEDARRLWLQAEQTEDSVACHNLAVLAHCRALDLEFQAESGEPLDGEGARSRDREWKEAFHFWQRLVEDERFWDLLEQRIRALNEPQLTAETARHLRDRLPAALLTINGQLAVRAVERGKGDEARRHLELLTGNSFSPEARDEALRRPLQPVRERIKLLCQSAEADADADPAHGDEATRRLIAQTGPLLAILDEVLPSDHLAREGPHDEVALRILACQVPFANKTDNWAVSLDLLREAMAIVASESARGRLQQNLDIVTQNYQYCTCWFCQTRPREDRAAISVPMYGYVRRTQYGTGFRVSWKQRVVSVPRCCSCRSTHRWREAFTLLGGLLGGLLGFGGYLLVNALTGNWFAGLFCISAGLILGGLAALTVSRRKVGENVRPESFKKEFPEIRRWSGEGWRIGKRPAGV